MMNRCGYQQSAFVGGRCDEGLRKMEAVVCPKPRRLTLFNPNLSDCSRSPRCSFSPQMEISDSKAGSELFDIILSKGGLVGERSVTQLASSPPFFCGSPPSRASNPLIEDAQFGSEKVMPLPAPCLAPAPVPAPPSRTGGGGGCVRMKYGQQQAAVRIEGFDCLSRDGRNRSISAMA